VPIRAAPIKALRICIWAVPHDWQLALAPLWQRSLIPGFSSPLSPSPPARALALPLRFTISIYRSRRSVQSKGDGMVLLRASILRDTQPFPRSPCSAHQKACTTTVHHTHTKRSIPTQHRKDDVAQHSAVRSSLVSIIKTGSLIIVWLLGENKPENPRV